MLRFVSAASSSKAAITTGALIMKSEAFVPQQNLFARPDAASVTIAPGAFGGASWSPVSYD